MIFASVTLTELAPILTIFVGMLAGFYALLKFVLSQSEKTSESDRGERQQLSKAIADMAESNREIAEATNKGNEEAKIRNGHLGEQNIKIARLVTSQNTDVKGIRNTNKKIVELLKLNKDQHIETQIVDVQTVNKEK